MNKHKMLFNFYSISTISLIYIMFAIFAYIPEKSTDGFLRAFFKGLFNGFFVEFPLDIAFIIFIPSLIVKFVWSDKVLWRKAAYKTIMCLVYIFAVGSTVLWSTLFFYSSSLATILAVIFDIYVSAIAIAGLKNIFFNKKRSV